MTLLDNIKASEYLEVVNDEADMESVEHGIAAMAEDIADSIRKTHSVDPLRDNAMTAIIEAAMPDTKAEMCRCLEENQEFIHLKSDTAERIYDLKEYVNSLPTRYLENHTISVNFVFFQRGFSSFHPSFFRRCEPVLSRLLAYLKHIPYGQTGKIHRKS